MLITDKRHKHHMDSVANLVQANYIITQPHAKGSDRMFEDVKPM